MKFIDDKKDYIQVFHFDGLGHLTNDLWARGYSEFDVMITSIKDDSYFWLSKSFIDKALEDGVHLFSNPDDFDAHKRSFEEMIEGVGKEFHSNIADFTELKRGDVERFLKRLSRMFIYFSKTEWFYTDKAYEVSKTNAIVKNNLDINYKLKEIARIKLINEVHFGNYAYLNVLCRKLSNQFNDDIQNIRQYNMKEILDLFDGKKIGIDDMEKRKIARLIFGGKTDSEYYFGKEVKKEINEILKEKVCSVLPSDSILRGTIANKGKITGRVKVIVSDPNTFDSLSKEFEKMQKGDILVAETTSPEFMPACEKAGAILANQGGLLSHAAVVSREFGIPCIVNLKVATKLLKDGDMVEVDADRGIVRILK